MTTTNGASVEDISDDGCLHRGWIRSKTMAYRRKYMRLEDTSTQRLSERIGKEC